MSTINEITYWNALLGPVTAEHYWRDGPRAVPVGKLIFGQSYTVRFQNEIPTEDKYATDFLMVYAGMGKVKKRNSIAINHFFKRHAAVTLEPALEQSLEQFDEGPLVIQPVEALISRESRLYRVEHQKVSILGFKVIWNSYEVEEGYLLEGRSQPRSSLPHLEEALPTLGPLAPVPA